MKTHLKMHLIAKMCIILGIVGCFTACDRRSDSERLREEKIKAFKIKDSLAIIYNKAILITDSAHSPIPDSIRRKIIKYFNSMGMDPNEYYTVDDFKLNRSVAAHGSINLLRRAALRDLYTQSLEYEAIEAARARGETVSFLLRDGAAGGRGDDILLIFDPQFQYIQQIISSE